MSITTVVVVYAIMVGTLYCFMPYPDNKIINGQCTIEPDVYECNFGKCQRTIARYNETIYTTIYNGNKYKIGETIDCSFIVVEGEIVKFNLHYFKPLYEDKEGKLQHAVFCISLPCLVPIIFIFVCAGGIS